MSDATTRPPSPVPSFSTRATVVVLAWLPVLGFVGIFLPRFVTVFEKVAATTPLPALTRWLLTLGRLDPATAGVGSVALLAGLVAAESLVGRFSPAGRARWAWFLGVAAAGLAASAVCLLAITLPLFDMPPPDI